MPKVVDGDERRATLIAATSEAIAREGLANVTLRSIARSAGWTTGIVTHYFADKRELLMATFRARADRARRQIESARAAGTPLLEAAIDAAMPLDDERLLDWRVFIAYMGAAIGDEDMAQLHRVRVDSFTKTIRGALAGEQVAGRLPAALDPALEADRLVALINGIALQAVLRPRSFTPRRQQALIDGHLRTLLRTTAPPVHPPDTTPRRRAR
jgi:AcrR family transcriptional regulator